MEKQETKQKRVRPRKLTAGLQYRQIIAGMMIFALAAADFMTMVRMFTGMGLSNNLLIMEKVPLLNIKWEVSEPIIYALLAAVLLEFCPTIMGTTLWSMVNRENREYNGRTRAMVGFLLSFICLCLAVVLVVTMRGNLIRKNGGFEAYMAGTYGSVETDSDATKLIANRQYVAHIFLRWSPLLTSLLAFAVSWTSFHKDPLLDLRRQLIRSEAAFLDCESEYLRAVHSCKDRKLFLWSDLSSKEEPIPEDFQIYKEQCFSRIRAKLVHNCVVQYPQSLARFNSEIEAELLRYITIMSEKSTIPLDIKQMKLKELLEKFDGRQLEQKKHEKVWNLQTAEPILTKELKLLIDNGLPVKQFKVSKKPMWLEKGRLQ